MTRRWLAAAATVAVAALLLGALWPRLGAPSPRLAASLPVAIPATVVIPTVPPPAPRPSVLARRHVAVEAPARPVSIRLAAAVATQPDSLAYATAVSAAWLDGLLARLDSPLAGLGAYLGAQARRWNIDPLVLLALSTYLDKHDPLAARAHNVGHIHAVGAEPSLDGYRVYPSWRAGVAAWFALVGNLYVRRWHLRTLDEMLPVYAAGAGRRGIESELNAMRAMLAAWRTSA